LSWCFRTPASTFGDGKIRRNGALDYEVGLIHSFRAHAKLVREEFCRRLANDVSELPHEVCLQGDDGEVQPAGAQLVDRLARGRRSRERTARGG
jgi:hypothetical protein